MGVAFPLTPSNLHAEVYGKSSQIISLVDVVRSPPFPPRPKRSPQQQGLRGEMPVHQFNRVSLRTEKYLFLIGIGIANLQSRSLLTSPA